jgi:hypothetical protein
MSKHTWNAVDQRDLSRWFHTYLEHEAEDLRQLLFHGNAAIVPSGQPLYLVLLLEVIATQARTLNIPEMLIMEVVGAALGVPMLKTRLGDAGEATGFVAHPAPSDFLTRLREQARAQQHAGSMSHETSEAPASPNPAMPIAGKVSNADKRIRIVRAGDVARKVIATLIEYEPLKDAMVELEEDEAFKLFTKLSEEIAKMITEGLQ